MGVSRFFARALGMALACAAVCLALSAVSARAAGPECPSAAMYIAAHADDTLLFQSPSLLRDVRSGRCVRTVFLTAGDAGKPTSYWEGRELGAEAGYAEMLGVANQWTSSQIVADGHSIRLETLDALPRVSIAYMRLPDGTPSGTGTPLYGDESLTKLWRSVKGGMPAISDIEAVDGSSGYDFGELVDALAAMMDSFAPSQIATQDYIAPLVGPDDHADHVATGKFAEEAAALYDRSNRLRGFLGYDSADQPINVFGDLLAEKSDAFYAYGEHDSDACADPVQCKNTPYEKWLAREYVAAERTAGAVAQAGYPQAVLAEDPVELDGSESSGEGGGALAYSWVQTGDTPVLLSGAATATPSFVAPQYGTELTFSLTVADGAELSEADFVTVAVDGPEPPPPDPPPAPGGGGSDVGEPAAATSPPAALAKLPRIRLSKATVRLQVGKASRHVVTVLGSERPWVECRGALPKGLRCRVTAARKVVVEGTSATKRAGRFRLTVQVTDQRGTVQRPLLVQVRRSWRG